MMSVDNRPEEDAEKPFAQVCSGCGHLAGWHPLSTKLGIGYCMRRGCDCTCVVDETELYGIDEHTYEQGFKPDKGNYDNRAALLHAALHVRPEALERMRQQSPSKDG